MAFTQDFFTSRNNVGDGNTRLGHKDRLWYDSITNTLRISDGSTPGGIVIGGGGGASVSVGVSPPVGADTGDLWWASDEGQMYIYYDDQWIQAAESVLARDIVPTDLSDLTDNTNLLFSGSYADLTNKPTIPTNNNQLTNGAGYITGYTETDPIVGAITGIVKADGAGNISAAVAGSDYIATETFTSLVQDTTPQLGGDLDAQSTYKIINLVSPSNNGDATNKIYVDSLTQYLADNRLVYIRSGDTDVATSTDTVLDWNSELVASTIPDFTHSSGVFTNTSTRTRRFLFQMQVAIRAQSTAFTEANIWFSFNGTFSSTNRRAQTNFTASTSAVMLTTSWTFTLAQNETVRGYFWCNQASVYGNTQSPPGSSFGNQYSSLIEVQELN